MKFTCFARPSKFWTRLAMMCAGVTVQGFGLSLLIRLALGTDPCSCLTQGVILYVPISFGTAQLLCHLVTFVFVLRFDMSYIGLSNAITPYPLYYFNNTASFFCMNAITGPRKKATPNVTMPTSPPSAKPAITYRPIEKEERYGGEKI